MSRAPPFGCTLKVGDLVDVCVNYNFKLARVESEMCGAVHLSYLDRDGSSKIVAFAKSAASLVPPLTKSFGFDREQALRMLAAIVAAEAKQNSSSDADSTAQLQQRISEIQAQLASATQTIAQQKAGLVSAAASAESVRADLWRRCEKAETALREWQSRSRSQQQQIDDLQTRLQSSELRCKSADEAKFRALVQLADAQQTITLCEHKQADALGSRSSALSARIAALETELHEERSRSETLLQSKLAAYTQLAHVQQRAADKARVAEQLSAALRAVTSAAAMQAQSTASVDAVRFSRLESQSSAMQETIEVLQMKIAETQDDRNSSVSHTPHARMQRASPRAVEVSSSAAAPFSFARRLSAADSAAATSADARASRAVTIASPPRSSAASGQISASVVAAHVIRPSSSAASQTNIGFSSALATSVPFDLSHSPKAAHVDSPRPLSVRRVGSGLASGLLSSPLASAWAATCVSNSNARLLRSVGSLACGSSGVRLSAHTAAGPAQRRTCWSPAVTPVESPESPLGSDSARSAEAESTAVESLLWSRQSPSPEPLVVQLDEAADGAEEGRNTIGFGVRLPPLQIQGAGKSEQSNRAVRKWSSSRLLSSLADSHLLESPCSSDSESGSDSDDSDSSLVSSPSSVSFVRRSTGGVVLIHLDDDETSSEEEGSDAEDSNEDDEEESISAECKLDSSSSSRPAIPPPLTAEQLAAEFGSDAESSAETKQTPAEVCAQQAKGAASDSAGSSDADSESEDEDSSAASAIVQTAAGLALREWYRRMRERLAAGAAAAAMHAESIVERGELDSRHWPKLGAAQEAHGGEDDGEEGDGEAAKDNPEEGDEDEQGAIDAQEDAALFDESSCSSASDRVASEAEIAAAHIEEVDEEDELEESRTADDALSGAHDESVDEPIDVGSLDEPETSYENDAFDPCSDDEEDGESNANATAPSVSSSASAPSLFDSSAFTPPVSAPSSSALTALSRWATHHAQLQCALSSSGVSDVCLPASVVFAAQRAMQREQAAAEAEAKAAAQTVEQQQQQQDDEDAVACAVMDGETESAAVLPSSTSPHSARSEEDEWMML